MKNKKNKNFNQKKTKSYRDNQFNNPSNKGSNNINWSSKKANVKEQVRREGASLRVSSLFEITWLSINIEFGRVNELVGNRPITVS